MPRATTSRRNNAASTTSAAAAKAVFQLPANVPHRSLVAALATRFKEDLDQPDLPLIVVNTLPQTSSAHVLVIWDKWKDLTIPERARIIVDAYSAAQPHSRLTVRLPMGLTSSEALRQGYLRYQIIALPRSSENVTKKQIKEAMGSVGGVVVKVGNDEQLRFATLAQAQEAYERLLKKLNKPIWTLVEEMASGQSGD